MKNRIKNQDKRDFFLLSFRQARSSFIPSHSGRPPWGNLSRNPLT